MNTQNSKQAHEMTNKELFDELKERGFFMFERLKRNGLTDFLLVSNRKPERDIIINWKLEEHIPNTNEYIEIFFKK